MLVRTENNHYLEATAHLPREDCQVSPLIDLLINAYPLLTKEEEVNLLESIQEADGSKLGENEATAARELLVLSNLRLVKLEARKRRGRGVPVAELFAEGVVGLERAIDGFELSFGVRFSTFAVPRVRQRMNRCLEDTDRNIRLPAHIQQWLKNVKYAEATLYEKLGRQPTPDEILTELLETDPSGATFTLARVKMLLQVAKISRTRSLDEPLNHDGSLSLQDMVSQPTDDALPIDGEFVTELLEAIPANWAWAIALRFGLNGMEEHSVAEICQKMGLKKTAINNYIAYGIKLMQQLLRQKGVSRYSQLFSSDAV